MSKGGPIAVTRLKSIVERVERLEEERKALGGDVRDIYAEAKSAGYDVRTIRKIVQERRLDEAEQAERETLLDTYRHALRTAVDLVESGVSLRKAEKATGVSKSSIHRALAVPAVSQEAASQGLVPCPSAGEDLATPVPDCEVGAGNHSEIGDDNRTPEEIMGETPAFLRRMPA
jgi:uncharacterized protein (UPF0335 family)